MRAVAEWGGFSPERPGAFRRVYDGLALLFLMWPATAGMWLLGSTRLWGLTPALLFSLLGSFLVFMRPLVFRDTPRWNCPPGFWVFLGLMAYVVGQVPWAAVPYAARWEALRWLSLLAAAFAWTQMGGRAHRWKWLLGVMLVAAALTCLYALIQEAGGSTRVLWTERPEQYGLRASGTYRCPNHFANMLAQLAPMAGRLLSELGMKDPSELALRLFRDLAPHVPSPAHLTEVTLTDGAGRKVAVRAEGV